MQIKRKSVHVAQVMREIRQAALKEKNNETRSKLWRWYYRLLHGEDEIEIMVKDAEMRQMLEHIIANGMLPDDWKTEFARLEAKLMAQPHNPPPPVEDVDDDIPPYQLRLFDD